MEDLDRLPAVKKPAWRTLARLVAAAVLGAVAFALIGQLMARTGGSCSLLCNPWVASGLGVFVGVISIGLEHG